MKMDVLRHQGSSCQDGTKRSDEALAESADDSARQIQRYIRLTYLIPELLKMVDEGIVSLTAGVNYSYLRQFEQMTVWMMLMEKSMSITTEKTEELKNASKAGELNEEQIRGYFKCNATEPKEKTPKKQSVKFAFDEISDFFPDMKPKEVKDKIIEILFAWYDAQQNAVLAEPTELDHLTTNGGERY
jgi:ParB family chromosome partitioning protein